MNEEDMMYYIFKFRETFRMMEIRNIFFSWSSGELDVFDFMLKVYRISRGIICKMSNGEEAAACNGEKAVEHNNNNHMANCTAPLSIIATKDFTDKPMLSPKAKIDLKTNSRHFFNEPHSPVSFTLIFVCSSIFNGMNILSVKLAAMRKTAEMGRRSKPLRGRVLR